MKRMTAAMLSVLTAGSLLSGFSAAAEDAAAAELYISVMQGDAVLRETALTVTDSDDDGILTVYDALYQLHEAQFEGGAAAGFAVAPDALHAERLWGNAADAALYYVNDVQADSLKTTVLTGDTVRAVLPGQIPAETTGGAVLQPVQAASVAAEEQPETQPPAAAPPPPAATTTTDSTITISMSVSRGTPNGSTPTPANAPNVNVTVNNQPTNLTTDKDGKIVITISENGQASLNGQNGAIIVNPADKTLVINGDTGSVAMNTTPALVINGGQTLATAAQIINTSGQVVNAAGQIVVSASTTAQAVNAANVPAATAAPAPAEGRSSYIDSVPETGDGIFGAGILAGIAGAGAAFLLILRRKHRD